MTILMVCCIEPSAATPSSHRSHDDQMAEAMVAAHNTARRREAVPNLTWSPQAASFAAEWAARLAASHCQMQHRPKPTPYGENIFWQSARVWSNGRREQVPIRPAQVVSAWVEEKADYDYRSNRCTPGKMCGHYTQVVWRNTTRVGCGMSVCNDLSQIWVCNYDPPGNFIGKKPF